MLKYNHIFRGLRLETAEATGKRACIKAKSKMHKVTLTVSGDGAALEAGDAVRLKLSEVAGIRISRHRPPVWPWILSVAAVTAGLAFIVPRETVSWIILEAGLLLIIIRFTREERARVSILTVGGNHIIMEFRCSPAEERKIGQAVKAIDAMILKSRTY